MRAPAEGLRSSRRQKLQAAQVGDVFLDQVRADVGDGKTGGFRRRLEACGGDRRPGADGLRRVVWPENGEHRLVLLLFRQGMHGSLGRDNTFNNMAAIGPDFRQGFTDRLPVGNADIAPTAAHILGLQLPDTGQLQGRVLSEALSGAVDGRAPQVQTLVSSGSATGRATVLHYQEIEGRRYLDDACFVELARAARQSCR